MAEPVYPDLTYQDQVLSTLITEERELQAMSDVDDLGAFSESWRSRLILLRVYILVCLEYASDKDDPFTLKLGQYQSQFDMALTAAKEAAKTAAASAAAGLFSIPLERA